MMKTVTEADVRDALPMCRAAIATAIENTMELMADQHHPTIHAAFQIVLIEKAAELARLTFATSRVDFALAAKEFYDKDDNDGG